MNEMHPQMAQIEDLGGAAKNTQQFPLMKRGKPMTQKACRITILLVCMLLAGCAQSALPPTQVREVEAPLVQAAIVTGQTQTTQT